MGDSVEGDSVEGDFVEGDELEWDSIEGVEGGLRDPAVVRLPRFAATSPLFPAQKPEQPPLWVKQIDFFTSICS